MRHSIIQALQYAQEQAEDIRAGVLLQRDLDEAHERAADLTDRFITCLHTHVPSLIITRATRTGCDLAWSDRKEFIRFELCINAPLIALFFYGVPPHDIVDGCRTCIELYNLIALTPEEINELDQKNLYHSLF